ncbi:MAG: ATP synthase F0 subunit B [Desulfobacteraceae bacterium]|jgi:F-type H+-transporting ATPase subunit b
MLNIDFSLWPVGVLWIQIANFLVLLLLLNIIAYRPIRSILAKRADEMNGMQEAAESLQEKYVQNEQLLQENVVEARKEGFGVKEGIKKEGLDQEKGMLQEAGAKTEEQLGKAREEISQTLASVRQTLQGEVDQFSQELAEKILGRSF